MGRLAVWPELAMPVLLAVLVGVAGGWALARWRHRLLRNSARLSPEESPSAAFSAATRGAGPDSSHMVQEILARSNILLWWGTVRRTPSGDYHWRIDIPVEVSGCSLRRLARSSEEGGLWWPANAPQLPEMNLRAQAAMETGASGYQQQFPILDDDGTR